MTIPCPRVEVFMDLLNYYKIYFGQVQRWWIEYL